MNQDNPKVMATKILPRQITITDADGNTSFHPVSASTQPTTQDVDKPVVITIPSPAVSTQTYPTDALGDSMLTPRELKNRLAWERAEAEGFYPHRSEVFEVTPHLKAMAQMESGGSPHPAGLFHYAPKLERSLLKPPTPPKRYGGHKPKRVPRGLLAAFFKRAIASE